MFAVSVFQWKSMEHLKKKGVKIREIVEFTDHAANQYKSKSAFLMMLQMKIPICQHYFGVKGPLDCAGAHFKKFI